MGRLDSARKIELLGAGEKLSIRRQCDVLGINRSTYYYTPHPQTGLSESEKELVMQRIDELNLWEPAWGVRKIEPVLRNEGFGVSRELVRDLMKQMGIITIYPGPNLSKNSQNARKVPYLLKPYRAHNLIQFPNLVWATDITYIKMGRSHLYLTAIIDWFSRMIIDWELSDTLETAAVTESMERAFERFGEPAIANSDQGSQYTSEEYKALLKKHRVRQSMDGKARWADNVVIERWFRTLKTNNIYVNDYQSPREMRIGLRDFIDRYNNLRPHASLKNQTPAAVYNSSFKAAGNGKFIA